MFHAFLNSALDCNDHPVLPTQVLPSRKFPRFLLDMGLLATLNRFGRFCVGTPSATPQNQEHNPDSTAIPSRTLVTVTEASKLTPCSKVLLQKPAGSQIVKKFPAFCGNRRFITTFTTARHLSLS